MPKFGIFNAGYPIVNQDGTPTRSFYGFCREIWNVISKKGGELGDDYYTKEETDELIADTLGNIEEILKEI